MPYTITELANLAGITNRTLRYYEDIGLLKPARNDSSGYRIYTTLEVDALQQILIYKSLGFELSLIKEVMYNPNFNEVETLKCHIKKLELEKNRISSLIETILKTIDAKERDINMKDNQKFEGLKEQLINENEDKYGHEIRDRYGDNLIDASNKKIRKMTKEDHQKIETQTVEINRMLKEAYLTNDPQSKTSMKACEMHKDWLLNYWTFYNKEAHLNLVQMYVDDPRFKIYYENIQAGLAEFLLEAMKIYLKDSKI